MSENKNIQGLLNKNRGFTTPNTINNIAELEKKLSNTSPTTNKYNIAENNESVDNVEQFDNVANVQNVEIKNDFMSQDNSMVEQPQAQKNLVKEREVLNEGLKTESQKACQIATEKLDGNTTITLAFRKEHKKILQEHFESEGIINYSTGIRSVLLKYMKAKKLI